MGRPSGTLDAIATLQLFNEKVAKLQGLNFLNEIRQHPGGALVHYERNRGWDSVFVGPSEETIDPVVLTLRFFIQNNERTSLQNVCELYKQDRLPSAFAESFADLAANLNTALDSPTTISVENGRALSHRDVLQMFIYGAHAHANRRWRSLYTDLKGTPFFPILQNHFVITLAYFVRVLGQMADLNGQALNELRA